MVGSAVLFSGFNGNDIPYVFYNANNVFFPAGIAANGTKLIV
jgi:hypothetical protein